MWQIIGMGNECGYDGIALMGTWVGVCLRKRGKMGDDAPLVLDVDIPEIW